MKILLIGGTGFLGTALADELIRQGHQLIITTRKGSERNLHPYPAKFIAWPPDVDELRDDLEDIEACINLAGEPIAGHRWTNSQKDKIYDSRIGGTRKIVDILRLATKLKVFLSGSAVGFYGNTGDTPVTENAKAGKNFLAEVCRDWETEAAKLNNPNVRTVLLRTGIVLGSGGGFLSQMEPIFRHHIGGPVGSGRQFISWLHLQDWLNAVLFCLNTKTIRGPVNLSAPNACTNRTFSYSFGKIFKQKFFPPAPAFAVKLLLGDMAEIALDGQRAVPQVLKDHNFAFQFVDLQHALRDIYNLDELNPYADEYFYSRQYVPAPLNKVFEFFSHEANLERITPETVHFRVVKKSTTKIEKGTLIDYKLKIHGIPTDWKTQISEWVPNRRFTDIQLEGPYKKWHHTHFFEEFGQGVLMLDRVQYRLPLGPLGRIGGLWFVKKDIRGIFDFRRQKVREIFPD